MATGQLANGEIPKSFDPEIAAFLDDNSVRYSFSVRYILKNHFKDGMLTEPFFFLNLRMVDRLRLVMLFFITQAVPQEMRNQLFQLSRCNYADREIANNLEFLGVKLDVVSPFIRLLSVSSSSYFSQRKARH